MIIPHEYVRYDKIKRAMRRHKHLIYKRYTERVSDDMKGYYSIGGFYQKLGLGGRKYIKRYWRPKNLSKFLKRRSSRAARKDIPLPNGKGYRKTFDYFWELY